MTETFLTRYVAFITAMDRHAPDGFVYASMNAFLKAHAQTFSVAADQTLPPRFHVWPRCCFDNAYRLARRHPNQFRYVEGLALGVIPVHHAWCLNPNDEVVDPTWAHRACGSVGTEYFGVVIPLSIARQIRSKTNNSILDNWQRGFPLMREPWADVLRNDGPQMRRTE
jgi:hypothetical protein